MTERWLDGEVSPAPEEMEEARRLAEDMDGGHPDGITDDVLSAVHLLESLAQSPAVDEVSSRRLRRGLVAQTARARHMRLAWRWAAAAGLAASVVLGAALWTAWRPPSERALEEREQAARAAVGGLVGSCLNGDSDSSRTEKLFDEQWSARLDSALEQRRFTSLTETSEGGGSSRKTRDVPQPASTLPTPGGLS